MGIHQLQIDTHGDLNGIRDRGLLESALAVPQFSFGGYFMHDTLHLMAAGIFFILLRIIRFLTGTKGLV